jgi:hypothetical protein
MSEIRSRTQVVAIDRSVLGLPKTMRSHDKPIEALVRHQVETERDGRHVTLLGVTWAGHDRMVYVEESDTDFIAMEASVEVNYDGMETPEDAAEALIDFIREDFSDAPIYVLVKNRETGTNYRVAVRHGPDGKAHGRQETTP